MAFLLVDIDGCVIARDEERIVVRQGALVLSEHVPVELDAVIAWGRVELTRAAVDTLLSRKVPIHLVSAGGKYRGCILPPESASVPRRIAQYQVMGDSEHRLALSKIATRAQTRNLAAVVSNWRAHGGEPDLSEHTGRIRELTSFVQDATTQDELRGIEGCAWRSAFDALAQVLPEQVGFTTRLRRPPPDPANALLGLFGVMTVGVASTVLRTAGLDPSLGFGHGHSRGGEALAMDLADIYRPMLCLAPAARLFSKGELGPADFEGLGYSATLTKQGVRRALHAYSGACRRGVKRRNQAQAASYLNQMRTDAAGLAHVILHPEDPWDVLEVR